jgi:hypothetical protein
VFSSPPASLLEVQLPPTKFPKGANLPVALSPSPIVVVNQPQYSKTYDAGYITLGIDDWGATQAQIALETLVEWSAPRGLASCYLKLPDLTGPSASAGGAGVADIVLNREGRLSAKLFPRFRRAAAAGEVEVAVGSGALDLSASQPPPSATGAVGSVWSCRTGRRLPSDFPQHNAGQCAAFVTFNAAGHDAKVDLVLVLLGAATSLMATLLFDILRRVLRAEAT